ncbi:hypothetical protein DesLBE_4622 [Desulfitobacterium sp. LBE]|uniref:hypothetical protein n=1 Tax=Desulfitobacterium sp. LBE TaxID=884086 RepID=UPI00119B6466|nr:hypothetical protein [Desulfitobacterium sp. LBE]TWH60202.1 hypothetical protein DesLBE_4622 [Desulfitobacterium sp. LBE]
MADMNQILGVSKEILKFTSPLTWLVVDTTEKIINKTNTVSNNGNLDEMKEEALRQEISLRMLEAQARVAQEISIARRIDTAEEVIIEEFYDKSGEGGIGLNLKEEGTSLGMNASGRSITKRVYTFKGWRDGGLEAVEKMIVKDKE